VAVTSGAGLYVLKREVASQVAYTNALAIHQIIDGLDGDNIVNGPKTEEWLCHIAYRMEYDQKSVWPKTVREFIIPAKEKLSSHRQRLELPVCEN